MDKNHQVSKLLVGKSQVSNNSNGKKSSGQTFTGKKKYIVKVVLFSNNVCFDFASSFSFATSNNKTIEVNALNQRTFVCRKLQIKT